MKKSMLVVSFGVLAFVLASCTNGGGNSSSSISSSSVQPTSSSDQPSSSSSSSSSQIVSSGLVEYIAARASFYNNGLTAEDLMSKSGLSIDAAYTKGNVVRLLEAAFKDHMPPYKGQRSLIGVQTYDGSYVASTKEVQDALSWLSSYGLWSDFKDENIVMTKNELDTILARFYQYFGTNEKDDFCTSNNYDFYFNDSDDDSVSQMSVYQKSHLVDSSVIASTATSYAKKFIASSSPYASRYKGALDYMEGEINYSFLTEEGVEDEIAAISSPATEEAWYKACGSLVKQYGSSPLFNVNGIDVVTADDGTSLPVVVANYGMVDFTAFDFTNDTKASTQTARLIKSLSLLGFSSTEAETKASLIMELGKNQQKYYTTTYKDYAKKEVLAYDTLTSKDILESSGIKVTFASILSDGGFDSSYLPCFYIKNEGAFLSSAKAMEDASLETKGAIGAYTFASINQTALAYKAGEPWDFSNIEPLLNRSMALDYQGTDKFAPNFTLTKDIIDNLVSTFKERSDSSSWLSKEGASAITDKLSTIKSYLYSTMSDGSPIDYSSYISDWTGKLSKDLGNSSFQTLRITLDSIKSGENATIVSAKSSSPLLANAYYVPLDNTVTITLGYLFSYGGDFQTYSTEELYSSLAFVCGHELTHGYDSNGAHYDKNGKYLGNNASIFKEADQKIFEDKQKAVVGLYDGKEYCPNSTFATKGATVLTEAMADIGGMGLTEGMAKKVDGFDFEAFYRYVAKHMAAKCTLLYALLISNDVHPFGALRCNTLLSNSSLFQSTFAFKEGDAMYRAESDRVVIW